MIPTANEAILDLETWDYPTRTYKLDLENKRIAGFIDDEEALSQAVRKVLYTERYDYVIYSHNYGVEFQQLIGKDMEYVKSDLKRVVEEAILVDNRMVRIDNFEIKVVDINTIDLSFTVVSNQGKTNITMGVLV